MRSALAAAAQRRAGRSRSTSVSAVPPAPSSSDYLPELATIASSILYRSPQPSKEGRPIFILNAAAFPDALDVDYDSLFSYVLARLPGEDELLSGTEYEIIFFAGGQPDGATQEKKTGPGMGWYLQAYHVLSRATRKMLQRLYIVHPRTWVRVLLGVFGTIVSPKFRRKIIHVTTLSQLATLIPIEGLLIPPAVYLHDRKLSPEIHLPYARARRAFGARHPLPKDLNTGLTRLPRVLRETTSFLLLPENIGTEGLFRIPPHSTLSSVLREAYVRGQQYIIWKEKGATFAQPGIDRSLIDKVRLEDAYGVHLAASLIKSWYRELREPIFPESSYEALRLKYGDQDIEVTPEDLVDLILPASPTSPLSIVAREIMTRHLLPLLSAVSAHEAQNKMSAQNLAICFSMCLLCGSNQMDDAKMSSILKRVLTAAIEIWPQLRNGIGIDANAFEADLLPPVDVRDYEDPLGDERPQQHSEDDTVNTSYGHRIMLADAEERTNPQRAPTLPPRHQAVASMPKMGEETPSTITRKPVLSTIDPVAIDPPGYSTVFDADGNSVYIADSPTSYTAPVNDLGPARRGDWSSGEKEEQSLPVQSAPPLSFPPVAVNMPKRKALSSEQKDDHEEPATPKNASYPNVHATAVAQKAAAARLAQRVAPQRSNEDGDRGVQSPEMGLSESNGADFRKPSWPASTTRQQPSVYALATPVLSPRAPQNEPATNGANLAAPGIPKPRAPSPGLLKRMTSMEASATEERREARPHRLDLKKASVEDLRRLYEERVRTAQTLTRMNAARRGSAQTS